jgi:hypothetical protein
MTTWVKVTEDALEVLPIGAVARELGAEIGFSAGMLVGEPDEGYLASLIELLAPRGYFPLTLTDSPSLSPIQFAVPADPVQGEDGAWLQQWAVDYLELADARGVLKAAVKRRQAELFAAGWTHDFGAAGTHTLDLRDADDKANWTLLLIKTQGMIAAGGGALPVTLRTQANATIELTATDANAAMIAFLAWGEDMLTAKWDRDAAIDAAEEHAALEAIDIEAGWPQ